MAEVRNTKSCDSDNVGNLPDRRKFLGFFPFFAGLIAIGATAIISVSEMIFSPFKKKVSKNSGDSYLFITKLDALTADSPPKKFKVYKRTLDAWTRYESRSIGAVYLKRVEKEGKTKILAWNARCPHAGCTIGYRERQKDFFCGCHNSRFTNEGRLPEEKTFAPRAMDTLKAELRNADEIWVQFINFQVGTSDKKSIS